MPNEFKVKNGLIVDQGGLNVTGSTAISGSVTITGSVTATNFTGSLFGTASWANNAVTASYILNAVSASFASNAGLLNNTASSVFATTGSNVFKGNQTVTGSLLTSGSNTLIGTTTLTGSLSISGSTTQIGNNTLQGNTLLSGTIGIVGNSTLTGSFLVSGSTTQTGNNTLLGNTSLSGSITISGSFGTPTPSINIYGDTEVNGYIRFDPVSTNINTSISASYIYVSGSTKDLYFSQNGSGYNNVTRLRWLEGNLYTGLLNGGLISTQSSTVYQVSSGSGIVVNMNASYNDNPYPTIKYLNWPNLSASIAPLSASYDQTFIAVYPSGSNSTPAILAQGTPFNDGQFDTSISIGLVLHSNHSTINGFKTQPTTAYGIVQRQSVFTRAFGPLKLTGFTLAASGSSTGSLIIGSGTAYADGAYYTIDANNPSYVIDSGTNISKIWRYRNTSSYTEWIYDTNNGAGYGAIDPTQYSNNGVLTAVPGTGINREWTIQRVYWYPNSVSKAIVVYYGNATYASEIDAAANISSETFVEAPNTAANAIYIGALFVRNNADFTDPTSYKIAPGGLFRNVGGSGGGGSVITQTLAGLSDVAISGPTNGQPLVYNNVSAKWENQSTLTATLVGNASSATTASYAGTASIATSASFASTASYWSGIVLNATSASFASTSSLPLRGVITGSVAGATLTFTKGDGTTFDLTVAQSGTVSTASYVTSSGVYGPNGANSILSSSFALTASYAVQVISASFAATAALAPNYVLTSVTSSMLAPYVLNSQTSSFVQNSQTSSFVTNAQTSSFVLNSQTSSMSVASASQAATASSADNFTVRGTLTAQTIVAQTITSSTDFVTGSTRFGSLLSNTHQFTGSVSITGSLNISNSLDNSGTAKIGDTLTVGTSTFTNRLNGQFGTFGIQSYSVNNGFMSDNMYYNGTTWTRIATGYGYGFQFYNGQVAFHGAATGTGAITQNAKFKFDYEGAFVIGNNLSLIQGDYTGATALFTKNGRLLLGTTTESIHILDVNGTFRVSGSSQITGSLIVTQGITGSLFGTSSWANNAISSSFATTASYWSGSILNATSASFAATAALAPNYVLTSTTASMLSSYVLNSQTSSFVTNSQTSSFVTNAQTSSFATTGSNIFRGNQIITGSLILSSSSAVELTVIGNQEVTGNVSITGNTSISAGNLSIFTANTPRRINLQVANGSKAAAIGIEAGGVIHSVLGVDTSGTDFLQIASKAGISFYSNSTIGDVVTDPTNERMRLTTNGNLILQNGGTFSDNGERLKVSGSSVMSGSLTVTQGITGSLFGTSSWAQNVLTSSYILQAVSASFASTASSADNFTVRGTLTAQTIVAQTITSSTDFVTGSTRFGSLLANTHQFTGSVSITGSLGIGTSSPLSLLNVQAASNTNLSLTYISNTGANYTQLSGGSVNLVNKWATIQFKQDASENAHHIAFSTANSSEDTTERVRITSSGSVGIGTTTLTGIILRISKAITGNVNSYGVLIDSSISSDVTDLARGFYAAPVVPVSTTLNELRYFDARQNSVAGTLTNQAGFFVDNNLTSATNNYGFRGRIPSGSNRWNIYMDGTANNYFAGNIGIGIETPARLLHIKAGAGNAGAIRVDSDNGNVANVLEVPTNGDWSFSTNSQEVMRLSNANGGRVGIGTATPTLATLQVNGNVYANSFTGSLQGTSSWAQNAVTSSYILNAVSASYASNGGVTQIIAGTNVTISPTNGLGVVTINSSGGGGATFPYTGSAIITGSLTVTGSIRATQGISGSFSGSYVGNGSGLTGVVASATPAGPNTSIQFNDAGTTSGSGAFTFTKATNTVTLQASGSTLLLITGSRGELFKVVDSGSTSILAVISSGSLNVLTVTTSSIDITGSLNVSGSITGSFPTNIRTHRLELGVSSTTAITTGAKGRKSVSYTGTIVGWRLVADQSTTTTIDIWKSNLAIPTVANTITGAAKPSLTAAQLAGSTTLTGWTTSVVDGDVFIINVDSNNNATYFSLELEILLNN